MDIYKNFIIELENNIKNVCTEFFNDSDDELQTMFNYAINSGRRYRPSLVLTGKLIGDDSFDELTLIHAITVELIHKYSLILDDSVDNDPLRRGKETYYKRYGRDNAQAMSAYIMNLIFKENNKITSLYHNDPRQKTIISLYEEILSDMSVGFISDLNKKSRDVRGIRKISDMQTTTLLRNSMLIGFISSEFYMSNECAYLYKTLCELGNHMGTIFQAYNDLEIFCGKKFQKANKGHLFPDFVDNRKNIVLSKVPLKILEKRDTNELVKYLNKECLFEEVFNEIFDVIREIKFLLNELPKKSRGTEFLLKILNEKEKVIISLSKTDIINCNNTDKISAM